jgi:transcription elongation factor Elf1
MRYAQRNNSGEQRRIFSGIDGKVWHICPHCGWHNAKVTPGAKGVYIKCKKCGKEIELRYAVGEIDVMS